MNFDNYRYFAAAAEELNFTKAARKLFMTQQALSKQIDKMEKEYNTRLFNRETPMSLTPAGECMYRHVCRILDNERQMRAELDAVLGQESRNLVVGVSYFRSSILIPRIMKEFSGLHPEICVTVKEKNLAGCVADLKLGKLDLMLFDFSYGDMKCDKWKAQELISMVRSIQPWLIVDNRLEGSAEDSGSILTANPTEYSGDFASPEQMIPPAGIRNELGNPVPWEACLTLNNNWGYSSSDRHYKSAEMVIHMLVECVSKGGNLLLNEVGEWIDENSKSIYGCGYAEIDKPEWGRYTSNGNKIYAHVMEPQAGAIPLTGIHGKIKKLRRLSDNSEVKLTDYWNLKEYSQNQFFFLNADTCDSYPLPDDRDTVVEVTLEETEE